MRQPYAVIRSSANFKVVYHVIFTFFSYILAVPNMHDIACRLQL